MCYHNKFLSILDLIHFHFFNFLLYLQSVPIHSANLVKSRTKSCRRVLTSVHIYKIGLHANSD
jgi:hypothetical protein